MAKAPQTFRRANFDFEDHTAFIERQKAQDRAEELLGCSKALNESALSALAERYDEARRRAVKLDEKHAGDGSHQVPIPAAEHGV
jgi:hypothetical protein